MAFFCPGCSEWHQVAVQGGGGPSWSFNGDYDRPTFAPSVRVMSMYSPANGRHGMLTEEEKAEYSVLERQGSDALFNSRFGFTCHSFVEDGYIRFLDDCTHDLRGQTVRLSIPEAT